MTSWFAPLIAGIGAGAVVWSIGTRYGETLGIALAGLVLFVCGYVIAGR